MSNFGPSPTPAAATGGFDFQDFASESLVSDRAGKDFAAAAGLDAGLFSGLAGFATVQAFGLGRAAFCEKRDGHRFEKFDFADDAVAAVEFFRGRRNFAGGKIDGAGRGSGVRGFPDR